MNINEAKIQIKNAVRAYLTKDEFNNYLIPIHEQRPIFLMGSPGIGKTAIMAQIAQELDIGLVSYAMTHHTRQSALGLPFIVKKKYGDKEYSVSEYTMSEIIASVYDMIEETGHKEGILFLDEINCVSETLAPAMLQFLQYKTFGKHAVPKGWIVVTAGNPPEFNNSVREFDIVTWDRLKRIDVEADYDTWRKYAVNNNTHASILTYLDINKDNFYNIETSVDGKLFVTARGWSDLSDMINIYENNGTVVDDNLISQYLHNKQISKSFAVYYDLFNKYKSDYQINTIMEGKVSSEIKKRAEDAKFDERLSLLGLLLNALSNEFRSIYLSELTASKLFETLKNNKMVFAKNGVDPSNVISEQIDSIRLFIQNGDKSSTITRDDKYALNKEISLLEEYNANINNIDGIKAFDLLRKEYDKFVKNIKKEASEVVVKLNNVIRFIDEVYSDEREMLIMVAELTINKYASAFISRYGSEEYFKHNKNLLFYERNKEIIEQIDDLDL